MRIEDILESIARIEHHIQGVTLDAFQEDSRTSDAVLRNLGNIGEASRHVPSEVAHRHPSIPWSALQDLSRVVEEYDTVDLEAVWRTVHDDLPPLVPQLRHILEEAG
ncbi:MAG TPA: HepT-like ribonuclease domain-containing protein [Longimicrobiaceae bacterium]|nr:HepT-like ribonuclease domain-containing protein [Longimicrobiaceae bacterium]